MSGEWWARLLPVQAVDDALTRVEHKLGTLPERDRRDAIEAELAEVRAEVERAEAAKHELVRGQKRIEDEIALVEDKISDEEAKLYSGGTDPGMLQDLSAEIEALKRRISGFEDDELELMEQVEPIDADLLRLADRRAVLDREAEAANAALAEAEAELVGERDRLAAERESLTVDIPADAVARYDTTRRRMGGTAVAAVEAGVCGACHLKLSAVEIDRIRQLPEDAEITCEECGRFLVRP